jgi:hypothetical protein
VIQLEILLLAPIEIQREDAIICDISSVWYYESLAMLRNPWVCIVVN